MLNKARAAAFALALLAGAGAAAAAGPPAAAGAVEVRAGQHPGFTRVVFDWDRQVPYRARRVEGAVELRFAAAATPQLARLQRSPAPLLGGVSAATGAAETEISLAVGDGVTFRHFRLGNRVVVDLMRPPAGGQPGGQAASGLSGGDRLAQAMSPEARPVPHDSDVFGADPSYEDKPYDPARQIEIYGAKRPIDEPRPALELGRPFYEVGPFAPGTTPFGAKNPLAPQLTAFGDIRTAVAWNDNGNVETGQVAARLNLDVDLRLTATERIHALFRPLDQGGQFTRYEFFGDDRRRGQDVIDGNVDTLFFEGDLGAIVSGLTDEYTGWDLPFTFGLIPLLFQNGVWMEDAILGAAVALPARNSPALGISNFDVTFFAGFDKVTTGAIVQRNGQFDDHSANLYGAAAFLELWQGYAELGWGYVDGHDGFVDASYHNLTAAFTRRYGGWLSNSVRTIWATGQDRKDGRQQTADGAIVLVENSLITHLPLTLVPYMNLFAGFDRPQSLARDAGAGGVLKNTGINFETDGLTGFPKLDDTGQNTYGGALGIQYLFDLDQQLVFEVAGLRTIEGDDELGRPARGDQFAVGVRYQYAFDLAWIFRADAIKGWRENDEDIAGVRFELRRKF